MLWVTRHWDSHLPWGVCSPRRGQAPPTVGKEQFYCSWRPRRLGKCLQGGEQASLALPETPLHLTWPLTHHLSISAMQKVSLGKWLNSSRVIEDLYGLFWRQNQAWRLNTSCHPTLPLLGLPVVRGLDRHLILRDPDICVDSHPLSVFGYVAKEALPENLLKRLSVLKLKYVDLLDIGCLTEQLIHWLLEWSFYLLPFRFCLFLTLDGLFLILSIPIFNFILFFALKIVLDVLLFCFYTHQSKWFINGIVNVLGWLVVSMLSVNKRSPASCRQRAQLEAWGP